MPLKRLIEYLDENHIRYTRIIHSPAYSAQVIAHRAHISGNELAKTIILKTADERFVMAVVPANYQIDVKKISDMYGAQLTLAAEDDFDCLFPGCETGAMPPFGNLFDLPVFVSETLADQSDIAFNAGNHRELLQMTFEDYDHLVHPKIGKFSRKTH